MTDERVEEVLFGINGKLSSIETKLDSMSENILKHEARITTLEQSLNKHLQEPACATESKDDFKTELIKMLSKCLVGSIVAIGTLVGSGSIIAKIFGV